VVGVLPLAGSARPVVDRDLDIGGVDSAWHGSRKTGDWEVFSDDKTARSQWWHSSGHRVTVFAYPQGLLEEPGEFRSEFRKALGGQGLTVAKDDADIPAPFQGFRFVGLGTNKSGVPVSIIHYFVVDGENHDLHHVLAAVAQEEGEDAEKVVRDFIGHAHWIGAAPPEKTAPDPPATQ